MLIDWVSMVLEVDPTTHQGLVDRLAQDRDLCVKLKHGEVATEWYPRESKRSDSHQLQVGLTKNRITLDGSPARLFSDNNVFGSSDLQDCARLMLRSASLTHGVVMPPLSSWRLTRVDLTQNYALASAAEVRIALGQLSKVAGGHLKASTFKESVYWNRNSPLWSAKAYDKGTHLTHMVKRGRAIATDDQLALSSRLLRLEVTIKNRLIKDGRLSFETLTEERLMSLFLEVAEKILPANAAEVPTENLLADALIERFGIRKGRALFAFWCSVKSQGVEVVQEKFGRTQWFTRTRDLRSVGISLGDLNAGTILSFRPKSIVSRPVDSWEDLRRAA